MKSSCPSQQPQIGQFIRALRQRSGLTQSQLGQKIGVSYETISRWENGRMQPSSLALRQLEQLLHELQAVVEPS